MKLDEILKIIDTPGVVMQLHNSPDEIGAAYLAVEQARDRRDDARENLKLAEANAEAQAWMESAEYGKAKELADAKKARIAGSGIKRCKANTVRPNTGATNAATNRTPVATADRSNENPTAAPASVQHIIGRLTNPTNRIARNARNNTSSIT